MFIQLSHQTKSPWTENNSFTKKGNYTIKLKKLTFCLSDSTRVLEKNVTDNVCLLLIGYLHRLIWKMNCKFVAQSRNAK